MKSYALKSVRNKLWRNPDAKLCQKLPKRMDHRVKKEIMEKIFGIVGNQVFLIWINVNAKISKS